MRFLSFIFPEAGQILGEGCACSILIPLPGHLLWATFGSRILAGGGGWQTFDLTLYSCSNIFMISFIIKKRKKKCLSFCDTEVTKNQRDLRSKSAQEFTMSTICSEKEEITATYNRLPAGKVRGKGAQHPKGCTGKNPKPRDMSHQSYNVIGENPGSHI